MADVNVNFPPSTSPARGVTAGDMEAAITQVKADLEGQVSGIDGQVSSISNQLVDATKKIDWISVANFPLIIPETDDTARINRALTSIAKGTLLIPDGIYNISGNGVIVPKGMNLKMSPEAEFVYAGTGTCLTLDAHENGNHVLGTIKKSAVGWKTTDTTSVGVKVKNTNWTTVKITRIFNFETGLNIYASGDGTGTNTGGGTCYNTFTISRIMDNKRGIRFNQDNYGWTNGNTFIGGVIRINSNNAGVVGSRYIDMSNDGNGNTFMGINMEGGAQEKTVEIKNSDNLFLNCRMELNPADSWHFLPGSHENIVIGGYGNLGHDTSYFKDEGNANVILGGRSLKLYGDSGIYGGPALTLEGMTSGSDIVFRSQTYLKRIYSEMVANGTLSFFSGVGKYDATINPTGHQNPVFRINPTGNSFDTGRTDGSEVPTPLFSVYTSARTDLKKTLFNNGGRIAGSFVLIAGATPDVSTSNLFKTNNTSATTITNFLTGTTGQIITIIGNDAFTTIAHNGNIILQGAVNFTMKTNDSIQLIRMDSGSTWLEIGRTII